MEQEHVSARRVYITGAAGLIGKDAVRAFCRAGWQVTASDPLARPAGEGLDQAEWRIERVEEVGVATFKGYDAVVHLGALTLSAEQKSFGAAADLPDARIMLGANVLGTENIFRNAAAAAVPCVVYASAGGLYGQPRFHTHLAGGTVADDGPFRPTSLYAHSKLMCEGIASFYAASSKTRFIGLRPTFSFGLGRLSGISGMFAVWLVEAIRGQRAVLPFPFGLDGQLQPIYVKDVAQNFVDAATAGSAAGSKLPASAVYNTATRELLRMPELLAIVRSATGNQDVHIAEGPFTPELQMPTMATAAAFDVLGCSQRYPFAAAIADMAAELARNPQAAP